MASHTGHDVRARLQELASDCGVHPVTAPISPASPPPTVRRPDDDFNAEELLKRQRLNASADKSQNGLKRVFSTNPSKKTWEPQELLEALEAHVGNRGSPGIAEAIIAKLLAAGGNINNQSNVKNRSSLLPRKRSMELMQPRRTLRKAIENRQHDMVAVLARYADSQTLDVAFQAAIQSGDVAIVQMLLYRGANAANTQDGLDSFRQLCILGGYADLIGLILQSPGKPSLEWLSMCMVDAARKGCFETVLRLSRASANGNHNTAEALRTAIAQSRLDIALAILTGDNPPIAGSPSLMQSFTDLFERSNVGPKEKLILAEAFLCAGAFGDPVSEALSQACKTEFYDMINLLVAYGASLEYQDASILRHAISRGQTGLMNLLLTENSTLSATSASECVRVIPKAIAPEERHALLSMLLRKGAAGTALHDALIDAVQAGDIQSVELLVTPFFPGSRHPSNPDTRNGNRGMVYSRHEMASVDHKNGLALVNAIRMGSLPMVKKLLVGKPSTDTLSLVFPETRYLVANDRYLMTECLLSAGVSGPCLSIALDQAIADQSSRRDEHLISLLLRHNADVNFNDGAGILSAIAIKDITLLETLLKNRPSPQTTAAALARAVLVDDRRTRYQMLRLLVGAGAGLEGTEGSEALIHLLAEKEIDMPPVKVLLEHGRVDANFDKGKPVNLAVNNPNPAVLELVLKHGKPTLAALNLGLMALCDMHTDTNKVAKVKSILQRSRHQESLDAALHKEAEMLSKMPHDQRILAVFQSLISAGANPNTNQAAVLCLVVRAADTPLSDLLFKTTITTESVALALRHSLNIQNPGDRLVFTRTLIEAGAPAFETNRALAYAIDTYAGDDKQPCDISLINLLAGHADSTDGEAVTRALKKERVDLVSLVLDRTPKKYDITVLGKVFLDAIKLQNRETRIAICTALVKRGVSDATSTLSDALQTAASDGDVALGAFLIEHGARPEHKDGQAVVEACRSGAPAVLKMLLGSKVAMQKQTLERGFQAATEIGDLKRRGDVFRLLLKKGVNGEVVDEQLVSAAKFGDDGEALVRLLLEFGASVDYNSGDAIWNATRSTFMGSLKLMLGVERVSDRQQNPSSDTLLKALKASRKLSREPRYQVVEWLFQVGLPVTEILHTALNKVVKDDPDLRLIRLMLKNGASPLANGCQTLTDAAQLLLVDVLAVLLEFDIPAKDVSWAFQQAFIPETSSTWLTEQGFQVAKMLLEKGAEGESLSLALSTAIDSYGSHNDEIARRFGSLLLHSKADVSYQDGLVVQKAAKIADSELIQQVLERKPDSRAISMAFPYIFDADLSEEDTLLLVTLFAEYHDGEERLDPLYTPPGSVPVIFRALAKFPRSAKMLQTLLYAGFYHDQVTNMRVVDEIDEDEQVTLLFWALFQPQKRVSSSVIELLIKRRAKVNFVTALSKMTPLMLAIKANRLDLVKLLLLEGAEVDVADITENTPMTMATKIGGDLGYSIISMILTAEPSVNDGSLHNAARELNVKTMSLLIDHGHEVDFPSHLHDGRSALGEICLKAAHAGPIPPAQEKVMVKAMSLLIQHGSDLKIKLKGKTVLHLALESEDPIPTTRALLKVGMWKHINESYNHFDDGTYTYSPSQYVARVMKQSDMTSELLSLLHANRALDVFYANEGAQPAGSVNLPEELLRAERERRAHEVALARTKEIAQIQNQIYLTRAEMEDARARRQHEEMIGGIKARQMIEDEGFAAELRRRNAEREAAIAHEQQLTQAGLTRARLVADSELQLESNRQHNMIEWEQSLATQQVANAKQLSALRIKEREAIERFDSASDARTVKRITEHKKLVDSQSSLAAKLASGGVDQRRQIGYITGELD
ncbi:hypothetical protein B0T26DRAFT_757860 [Lasiosphaeria miniovina]|uniref:Ankyrin repeat containing protein n=1 Tax=Lasiosphaeria miniovina TaxID=1954250 RepID=A0AA40DHT7_9PEZI|nr:uncharacterized protein B0T26DRAFT_757860 [Lasiosphaeria miniovina]KAK0701886.1 hypothetical protein B0T26DRAFT_757860 [Lasiosphaeria miniovina]